MDDVSCGTWQRTELKRGGRGGRVDLPGTDEQTGNRTDQKFLLRDQSGRTPEGGLLSRGPCRAAALGRAQRSGLRDVRHGWLLGSRRVVLPQDHCQAWRPREASFRLGGPVVAALP